MQTATATPTPSRPRTLTPNARLQAGLLLDLLEVCDILGIAPPTLYNWIAAKEFPAPIKLGSVRCVRWKAETLQDWIDSRPSARDENNVSLNQPNTVKKTKSPK